MKSLRSVYMIILVQPDLAQAVEFYKNLGLRLVFHIPDTWAEFMLNDIKIGLCPSQNAVGRHTGVVLEVDDLMQWYQDHKETITFVNEPLEKPHGLMIGFKDPGGNIIDLYQPTPEKFAEFMRQARQCCMKEKECGCNQKQEQI